MHLVDYSDSSSDDENEPQTSQTRSKRKAPDPDDCKKRPKSPPPLPTSFHSLYAFNVRTATSDDPSLHAGRTRQVPHIAGNWPTHVYLEWYPSKEELVVLDQIIEKVETCIPRIPHELGSESPIHSFLRSELGAQRPLHISLSAPLVLKSDQHDQFERSVRAGIAESLLQPFSVGLASMDWVGNQSQTRFFLVLRLRQPEHDELNKLLRICNASAQDLTLELLYGDPSDDAGHSSPTHDIRPEAADRSSSFHISVAWTLHKPDKQVRERLAELNNDQLQQMKVRFSRLKLKIGNSVIDIPLAPPHEQLEG